MLLRYVFLIDLIVLLFWAPPVAAQDWIVDTIYDRAVVHGVSGSRLECIGRRESRLDPGAVGDGGQSLGLFQLHRRGLLPLFYQRGYGDPFNAWEASDFTAWAFSQGLAAHWTTSRSC